MIAATQDRSLRAWDADDGRLLAAVKLPASAGGVPAVYMSGGRQFIAVPMASPSPRGTLSRNSIVAFALPPDRAAVPPR